ncbi:hypothetical protein KGQ24_02010 [Patescibacteria group bacterium]|nr:hypothetical protein [Patescibacteria group bacterium]
MDNIIHSWKTKEFEHYEKGSGWYLTFFIVSVMLIGYMFFQRDWFGGISLLVILAIAYLFSRQVPRDITVEITDRGIKINTTSFPYQTLRRFWIVDHSKASQLHVETTAYLNRFLVILLNGEDPAQIAAILRNYLPETRPNQETVAQRIARTLKF